MASLDRSARRSRGGRAGVCRAAPLAVLAILGCSAAAPADVPPDALRALRRPDPSNRLSTVGSWGVQLQGLDVDGAVERLERARLDMLVIEPSNTVRGQQDFPTREVVARVHASAGDTRERKLCLAYLNVGQAESYRTYWTAQWRAPENGAPGSPEFVISVDPDGWEENYPVAYWDPRWQAVLWGSSEALLDRALDAGFDGVYLDWVLGFVEPAVVQRAHADHVDPARAMVGLIALLRAYARERDPDFLVIAQNGAPLAATARELFAVCDGISQEDHSFRGSAGNDWDDPRGGDIATRLYRSSSAGGMASQLDAVLAAGLPVFTLDYALVPRNAELAAERARRRGFVPFVSRISLSQLPDDVVR